MHRLAPGESDRFEDDTDEEDAAAAAMAPPAPPPRLPSDEEIYMVNKSYPVQWQEAARLNAGDYYDTVCGVAPDLFRSLLQRDPQRDWAIVQRPESRFAGLLELVGESEHRTCDELLEAWAPDAAPHAPPAELRDYGPRPDERMTFESALMTEIAYFLGLDKNHAELSRIGTGQQLREKVTGPERGRAAYVTGIVYGGDPSPDSEELAKQRVASVLGDVYRALGLRGDRAHGTDPLIDDLRVAVLGGPAVLRFGFEGVLSAVQVVAYVQWTEELSIEGAVSRGKKLLDLLGSQAYRNRAFSRYLLEPRLAGQAPGTDFPERMHAEISSYFRGLVASATFEKPANAALADLRESRGAERFYDATSFERLFEEDLAKLGEKPARIFKRSWFWANWNYALYTRTVDDLKWFLSPADNPPAERSEPFRKLQRFFADFYDREKAGVDPRYERVDSYVGLTYSTLVRVGLDPHSDIFTLIELPRASLAAETRYRDGLEYGTAALPWFIMTAERARMVLALL